MQSNKLTVARTSIAILLVAAGWSLNIFSRRQDLILTAELMRLGAAVCVGGGLGALVHRPGLGIVTAILALIAFSAVP